MAFTYHSPCYLFYVWYLLRSCPRLLEPRLDKCRMSRSVARNCNKNYKDNKTPWFIFLQGLIMFAPVFSYQGKVSSAWVIFMYVYCSYSLFQESIVRFVEDKAFSPTYDLATPLPPPPPPHCYSPVTVSKLDRRHTGRLRREKTCWREWWGGARKPGPL